MLDGIAMTHTKRDSVNGLNYADYFLSTFVSGFFAMVVVYYIRKTSNYAALLPGQQLNRAAVIIMLSAYQIIYCLVLKKSSSASSTIQFFVKSIGASSVLIYFIGYVFFSLVSATGDDDMTWFLFFYFVTVLASFSMIPIYASYLPNLYIVPAKMREVSSSSSREKVIQQMMRYAEPVFYVGISVCAVAIAIAASSAGDNNRLVVLITVAVYASLLAYYFYYY